VIAARRTWLENGRRLSILVADDEQDTVITLAAILEDEGHVVHTVTNGALVMDAVRRFKPEVCILDIQMPGETGYSLARQITAERKPDRPLLIAISGKWKTQVDRFVARSVGFDYFFQKPTEPADLIAALDQLRGPTPAA
jgi:CheY-like chemotaxis protein